MKKHRGRPKEENKRDLYVNVRMADYEMRRLLNVANYYGCTISEAVRRLVTMESIRIKNDHYNDEF